MTVRADDGNGGTVTQAISVTVTNVNESPTITSPNTASVSENQVIALTVVGDDVDGDVLTYTIDSGADAGLFSIDGASGELTFDVAPDFDVAGDANGDNVYEVTDQAEDGNRGTVTQANAATAATGAVDLVKTVCTHCSVGCRRF